VRTELLNSIMIYFRFEMIIEPEQSGSNITLLTFYDVCTMDAD